MGYLSLPFVLLLLCTVAAYYLLPMKIRWLALLACSLATVALLNRSAGRVGVFLLHLGTVYLLSLGVQKNRRQGGGRAFLGLSIAVALLPLLLLRANQARLLGKAWEWAVPVGLSFYSLQMVSYLVDLWRGEAEGMPPLRFVLFFSFFPQLLQGPIPRFRELAPQLQEGHAYDLKNLRRAFQMALWALFLKYMIADKAGLFTSRIFDAPGVYEGWYLWLGAALYALQIYADFLSCVTLSQAMAAAFGISLQDNFKRPYLSLSIRDFWRRWHLTLSRWLRDYVYIPLGGSRKGKLRKTLNVLAVFWVSGLWHGGELRFLLWGSMHAFFQVLGELLDRRLPVRWTLPRRAVTLLMILLTWVMFRAPDAGSGIAMLGSMLRAGNIWIFVDGSLTRLGVDLRELALLLLSCAVLIGRDILEERGCSFRERVLCGPAALRWLCCAMLIWSVWIFGTYGFGYHAQEFIYGGF